MVHALIQAFQFHPGATGTVMVATSVAQFIRYSCFNFTPSTGETMPETQTVQKKEQFFNLTPHNGEDCATSSYKEPKCDKTFNSTSPRRARIQSD